jgi:dephospho-CoA kinase
MPAVATKPVLGVIGAIGAGKTAAAHQLGHLGGAVVDCDQLGHEALLDTDVQARLVQRWGAGILGDGEKINRRAVANIVFNAPSEKAFLESVLHPQIGRMVGDEIRRANQNVNIAFIVVDAAVLLEAGWKALCDKVVYIDAPLPRRLQRLQARSGWDAAELARREAAQWPAERRQAEADAVISNDGSLEQLRASLWNLLTQWGWPAHTHPTDTDDRGHDNV